MHQIDLLKFCYHVIIANWILLCDDLIIKLFNTTNDAYRRQSSLMFLEIPSNLMVHNN